MPHEKDSRYKVTNYVENRKKLSGTFFEIALPNEYLVEVGNQNFKPILGGKRFRLFRKYMRVPASVQTLYFVTDNANQDFQGIGIEGYATWRVNPDNPEVAIKTLDFFDSDDPTARTNEDLKTICVEAVRHVISNMNIEDALKKKDEIAANLKTQLGEIEKKWGILFDQVGIEKVQIMSSKLFEQLQSQFRDGLRLEVEKKRITTDREIAKEANILREKTELEAMDTEKKLNLVKVENEAVLKEETFRKEMTFNLERAEKEAALSRQQLQLKEDLVQSELSLLRSEKDLDALKQELERARLDIERIKREIEQSFSQGALTQQLIAALPSLFESVKIDNYSVMETGGDGLSPVGKFLMELSHMLKSGGLKDLLGGGAVVEGPK